MLVSLCEDTDQKHPVHIVGSRCCEARITRSKNAKCQGDICIFRHLPGFRVSAVHRCWVIVNDGVLMVWAQTTLVVQRSKLVCQCAAKAKKVGNKKVLGFESQVIRVHVSGRGDAPIEGGMCFATCLFRVRNGETRHTSGVQTKALSSLKHNTYSQYTLAP